MTLQADKYVHLWVCMCVSLHPREVSYFMRCGKELLRLLPSSTYSPVLPEYGSIFPYLVPLRSPSVSKSSYFLFPKPWHLSSHACELTFFLLNFHSLITSSRVALAETSPICRGWHGSAVLIIPIPLHVSLCGGQLFFTIPGGSYFQKDTLENKGHILFFFVSLVLRQYLAL